MARRGVPASCPRARRPLERRSRLVPPRSARSAAAVGARSGSRGGDPGGGGGAGVLRLVAHDKGSTRQAARRGPRGDAQTLRDTATRARRAPCRRARRVLGARLPLWGAPHGAAHAASLSRAEPPRSPPAAGASTGDADRASGGRCALLSSALAPARGFGCSSACHTRGPGILRESCHGLALRWWRITQSGLLSLTGPFGRIVWMELRLLICGRLLSQSQYVYSLWPSFALLLRQGASGCFFETGRWRRCSPHTGDSSRGACRGVRRLPLTRPLCLAFEARAIVPHNEKPGWVSALFR